MYTRVDSQPKTKSLEINVCPHCGTSIKSKDLDVCVECGKKIN